MKIIIQVRFENENEYKKKKIVKKVILINLKEKQIIMTEI